MPLSSLRYTIIVLKLNLVLYLPSSLVVSVPATHTQARRYAGTHARTHTHPPSFLHQGILLKMYCYALYFQNGYLPRQH